MPPKAAPHRGRVKSQCRDIDFTPAPRRGLLQSVEQDLDRRVRIGCGMQRMAAFTGPEPGVHAGGDRVKELAVFALWLSCRAGEAAKYARRCHADESPPVIGRIPRKQGLIKCVFIWQSE